MAEKPNLVAREFIILIITLNTPANHFFHPEYAMYTEVVRLAMAYSQNYENKVNCFLFHGGGGLRLSPAGTSAINCPIVPAQDERL
jgi:hypothetical protein